MESESKRAATPGTTWASVHTVHNIRTKVHPEVEGFVAVGGALVVPVVAVGGVHRAERAASGPHRRVHDQLTAGQLRLERLPVSGPSDQIVRLQAAALDRPRLALVYLRHPLVGYFIGKNIRAHVKWRTPRSAAKQYGRPALRGG